MQQPYDLIVKSGRLIDPAQSLDAIRDVAIRDGRVASIGEDMPAGLATRVVDATGRIVTPGLIDLHTHVFAGTYLSVEPDPVGARSGVTTMVDTGSAGAANFRLFRDYVIQQATTRILPFLNIWITGGEMHSLPSQATVFVQVGDATREHREPPKPLGYFDDVRYASVEDAIHVVRENPDLIVGIKVWVNPFVANGDLEPLRRARKAAEATGLPVMVCIWHAPPSMSQVLPLMEEGDILTHSYGSFTGLVGEDERILPAAREARERGVIFDVGHGVGSLDFQMASRALARGFTPDTISSDLHSGNLEGPVYDLPTTMAKFMALGMSLPEVIRATTARPAEVLRRQHEIGSLRVGMEADLAVFDLVEGELDLVDAEGQHLTGKHRLVNRLTMRGGQIRDQGDHLHLRR